MFSKSSIKKRITKQKAFFEEAYKQHLKKIQFYAYNYLMDECEAKSVAQDVFLTFWENLDELDIERDILPYLITIAKFKCLNIIRKRQHDRNYKKQEDSKQTRIAIAYEALSDYTSTMLYSEEIMDIVTKSLEEMPEKVKSTYILSRMNNLRNREIAEEQLVSIKTVEYRLNYAFRILRKNLHDYLYMLFIIMLLI